MSTTPSKRSLADALADAKAFKSIFPEHTYRRWEFAGSIRRGKSECSDVEHVIMPVWADRAGPGLFAEPVRVNLLFDHLDSLFKTAHIQKHIYGDTGFRWGEIYRGVDFRGFNHEIFTATAETWPSILAIRTGSADFSRKLVMGLIRKGMRNDKGRVWKCDPCPNGASCVRCEKTCAKCKGTGLMPMTPIECLNEREYFALCGYWCNCTSTSMRASLGRAKGPSLNLESGMIGKTKISAIMDHQCPECGRIMLMTDEVPRPGMYGLGVCGGCGNITKYTTDLSGRMSIARAYREQLFKDFDEAERRTLRDMQEQVHFKNGHCG